MIAIERHRIDRIKERFPNLTALGLVDDAFVLGLIAADVLGCRPCDVRMKDVEIKT